MKLSFIVFLSLLFSCNPEVKKSDLMLSGQGVLLPIEERPTIQFKKIPEKELIKFLDSINAVDSKEWAKSVSFIPDSVFRSQKTLNRKVEEVDFQVLKLGLKEKLLTIDFIKRIFPEVEIGDGFCCWENGEIPFELYPFEWEDGELKKFAIVPAFDQNISWEYKVYFFDGSNIISVHHIYHRYGLSLDHFIDEKGEVVFYYKRNYGSGSGIWWFNYNFYRYADGSTIPILNELENANLTFPWGIRSYWLRAQVLDTIPLTMKMVYYQNLLDPVTNGQVTIVSDSTLVKYKWSEEQIKYEGDFDESKFTRNMILSYYHGDSELLFLKSHYEVLKALMDGEGTPKKRAVLYYLSQLKNDLDRLN